MRLVVFFPDTIDVVSWDQDVNSRNWCVQGQRTECCNAPGQWRIKVWTPQKKFSGDLTVRLYLTVKDNINNIDIIYMIEWIKMNHSFQMSLMIKLWSQGGGDWIRKRGWFDFFEFFENEIARVCMMIYKILSIVF